MKMNKKKVLVASLAISLIAILSFGTIAWFNAEDKVTNKFMVATSEDGPDSIFSIDVFEQVDTDDDGIFDGTSDYDAAVSYGTDKNGQTYKEIVPGDNLGKKPWVRNTGSYDQYIRVQVTVNNATAWKNIFAKYHLTLDDIFLGHNESLWTRNDAEATEDTTKDTNSGYTTAIEVKSGNCEIKGGAYHSTTENIGTKSLPNPCIKVSKNSNLKLDDATILAEDIGKGNPNAIYIEKDGETSISNCNITASSPYGPDVNAVYCDGFADVSKSNIFGYANYTANAAGTDYASRSRGVYNTGKMIVRDCYVIGTHSGITSIGVLWVDGGTYESYGHGGIYYGGSNTTSYLKNATVQWCAMPQGYYDDGVAGTNKAGMYIGGVSARNIIVYVDNCTFNAPSQSIVIRGTSNEKDDALYISNSTINTSAKIRIDANNKLCIGSGNNFTDKHTRSKTSKKGIIENTNTEYLAVINEAFQSLLY